MFARRAFSITKLYKTLISPYNTQFLQRLLNKTQVVVPLHFFLKIYDLLFSFEEHQSGENRKGTRVLHWFKEKYVITIGYCIIKFVRSILILILLYGFIFKMLLIKNTQQIFSETKGSSEQTTPLL